MSAYPNGTRKAGDVQIAVFQYVAALAFLWLLSGFWQLQVQSPDVYAERAEQNRIKSLPVLAPRRATPGRSQASTWRSMHSSTRRESSGWTRSSSCST